jgi:hypothetical protein
MLHGPGAGTTDATHNLNTATEFVFHPGPTPTVVEIGGANAGRWTITPAPGSPAITKVETSWCFAPRHRSRRRREGARRERHRAAPACRALRPPRTTRSG